MPAHFLNLCDWAVSLNILLLANIIALLRRIRFQAPTSPNCREGGLRFVLLQLEELSPRIVPATRAWNGASGPTDYN